jgi:hypothetical protein
LFYFSFRFRGSRLAAGGCAMCAHACALSRRIDSAPVA